VYECGAITTFVCGVSTTRILISDFSLPDAALQVSFIIAMTMTLAPRMSNLSPTWQMQLLSLVKMAAHEKLNEGH
jgi:hypothetical protein